MTNLNSEIETCIICLQTPTGYPQGTGFILTPTLAVTCAHVVQACGVGPGDRVRLSFQAGGESMEAEVLADGWHLEADVAFLRLLSPLPSDVTPAILGASSNTDGHTFRAFGYPNVGDFQGVWAEGKILGLTTDSRGLRVLQLRTQEIAPGMSGAPVLDADIGRVVGMVSLTYNADGTLKFRDAAFAISSETLYSLRQAEVKLPPVEELLQLRRFEVDLISGKDPNPIARALVDIATKYKNEEAALTLWSTVCHANDKLAQIIDPCAYAIGDIVLKTSSPALVDICFDIFGKSTDRKSTPIMNRFFEDIVDKFAFTIGRVIRETENGEIRQRACQFVDDKASSDDPVVRDKYNFVRKEIFPFCG